MGRAEDIYERIKRDGLAAIDGFIADRESEELFLDFKRSSDDGRGNKLSADDRNSLSKAISGFGNSEGGIIVWGVECSKDNQGADVASAKCPIADVQGFRSKVENAVSGCTIPPHSTVENHVVIDSTGTGGFLVTLVPKSNHVPHQTLPGGKYLIRAGSSFVPTPHDVLAGMFGRRPQPNVYHQFTTLPAEVRGESVAIKFGFVISNEGPVIASNMFVTILVRTFPGECGFRQSDPDNWFGTWSFGRHLSLVAKDGVRLAPMAYATPVILEALVTPPFCEGVRLDCVLGSAESEPVSFTLGCDRESLQAAYEELIGKFRDGTLTPEDGHSFVNKVLRSES